jgi:hypothetical protein
VRVASGEPGMARGIELIDEKGATLLHRIQGNGGIAGAPANATEGLDLRAIGFGSDEFAVGGKPPKISAASVKIGAGESAKRQDELTGIVVVKCGPGKLQEKLLESLVRVRRVAGTRISGVGCQCAPMV